MDGHPSRLRRSGRRLPRLVLGPILAHAFARLAQNEPSGRRGSKSPSHSDCTGSSQSAEFQRWQRDDLVGRIDLYRRSDLII